MSKEQSKTEQGSKPRAVRTTEQKIADAELKLNRLKEQQRRTENGQKIICGGLLMNAVKDDPAIREWFLGAAKVWVTRKADIDRLQPFLDELKQMPAEVAKTS